ncbi:MAG TPA: acyltransferase [Candidatus Limnocylindrales bacterium]|nr:acyltransferase [Candidatus Limnocylindrales bacterium]
MGSAEQRPRTGRVRSGSADWLKAAAIIAVVITHSMPTAFQPTFTAVDRSINNLVSFHVPVFLLVAGWLSASRQPLSWSSLARRIGRVIPPYVIASTVMTALGYARWDAFAWNLVLGSALGPYYYIPVWVVCVLSGWVWSRLSPRATVVVLAVVLVATAIRYFVWPMFWWTWAIRDPIGQGWLACFLIGWSARIFSAEIWMQARPEWAVLAVLMCLPWLIVPHTWSGEHGITLRHTSRVAYAVGVAWLGVAWLRPEAPRPVQWLSSATLPIFLYHEPISIFLRTELAAWPPMSRVVVVATVATLVTCAGVAVAQRLIPVRLRSYLLGA